MNSSLPSFETERLILRPVTHADIPAYEKHFIDYEVICHLTATVPWPYPENGVAEFLESSIFSPEEKEQWMWGIFEKSNPTELIGAIHLWRDARPENRGFWLGKPFWGKGYMTEAVMPITNYAFTHLGFEKLIFANAVGNLRSRRVKEKCRARVIGMKNTRFVDPRYTQSEIWELQKQDWPGLTQWA